MIHVLDQLPGVEGVDAAVIGQGPIGLLFSHVLKNRGTRHVTGVDTVDRSDMAGVFGVDDAVQAGSGTWAAEAGQTSPRPAQIIEAIGHQAATLRHAVEAVAE